MRAERVRRLLSIRPGEGGVAVRILALMFLVWGGATIGASGVESLLFSRFGPGALRYLFIALAFVTFPTMMALTGLLGRFQERALLLLPLALAGILLVARVVLAAGTRWFYPVLWLLMMIVWTSGGLAIWGVAGTVSDTRQAKRLFPLYGAGLILGGTAGGVATAALAGLLHSENLLLVWAGSLVAAFLLARSLLSSPRRRAVPTVSRSSGLMEEARAGVRFVRGSGLLRWMSVAMALFGLLYFALSLPFAEAVTARYVSADRLAGFLGVFFGASNGAALLVSLLLANRLFARFGLTTGVLALAAIYAAGFALLAVRSTFGVLVGFRFTQMVWVNGVWATGWQALFNVVPPERRNQVRTFMDGGPTQIGILLAGLTLIAYRAIGAGALYAGGIGASLLVALAMWRARFAYGRAVAEALRAGHSEVFRQEEEPFGGFRRDAAALSTLLAGADGGDPGIRRLSLELLAEVDPEGGAEAFRAGAGDHDHLVRRAAARGLSRIEGVDAGDVLRSLLSDPDPGVRSEAAVGLAGRGEEEPGLGTLREMAGSADAAWRAWGIHALGRAGSGPETIERALSDPEPNVRRAGALALAGMAGPPAVARLVPLLGEADGGVRAAAVEALARIGEASHRPLLAALSDPGTEAGALAALVRLPQPDADSLRSYAARHAVAAERYHALWRAVAGMADEGAALLAFSLRRRALDHGLKALRAMAGLGARAPMELAIAELSSRDADQRANALETLDALGGPELRPLVRLWEEAPGGAGEVEAALLAAMGDDDPWLRACAAIAGRRSPSTEVRAALARLAGEDPDRLVREAARRTEGETAVETLPTLSLMDRVLFLRRVHLFAELDPGDLKHVAEIAVENLYPDGHVVARQGDRGDEMHVIVSGAIRVLLPQDGGVVEVARRGPGEHVGEMALITEEPRMASLIAAGGVRTLTLDRPRFERILLDRPQVSVAIIQVLCDRLKEFRPEGVGSV